jgi:hypothetical protein
MPRKEWKQNLSGEFEMLIRRETHSGVVLRFSVVLLYRNECIARYDSAHGRAHRDVVGIVKGWIKSIPCPLEMSYNQAFDFAIRDFEANYENYLATYLKN